MELTFNLILLLTGITILVWGANKFVDHASVIAKHLGVGDLVIGLTLIAGGTSAPEVFVGISAGANVLASERWIKQNNPNGIVVTILCDRGERYFSVL